MTLRDLRVKGFLDGSYRNIGLGANNEEFIKVGGSQDW